MQEIAAGRAFFSEMGYDDVKVGDTVTLDYRAGMQSEYKPEEFVVSGILYDRDEYTIEASYVAFGRLPEFSVSRRRASNSLAARAVSSLARVWSLLHERLARTRFDSGRAFGHG